MDLLYYPRDDIGDVRKSVKSIDNLKFFESWQIMLSNYCFPDAPFVQKILPLGASQQRLVWGDPPLSIEEYNIGVRSVGHQSIFNN